MMITDSQITYALPNVPREAQEINFVIPPCFSWSGITKFTTYVIDIKVTPDIVIEAIDPNLIRGRNVCITYQQGGEAQAKRLAYLVKKCQPHGAYYITPAGDWVQLVDGHWKCLVRIPK